MSHVRNLFLKPATHGYAPPPAPAPVPLTMVPDFPAPSAPAREAAPKSVPLVSDFPSRSPAPREFLVEQARIRPEHRIVAYTDPHSPAADRFRYLRMRLREPWSAGKLKRLLITSPLAGDGKSTVILNLATALSERGQRTVLLVEADLHRSCLVEKLGLKPWAGLAECLHDGLDPMSAIRRVDPFGWHLLPAGEPPLNPTELLQTPALGTVLERVSPNFDWILIDSPPAVALTDAISLQQQADASLLVVKANCTPREAVEQATTLLGTKNVLGIVLNGLDARNHLYNKYQA